MMEGVKDIVAVINKVLVEAFIKNGIREPLSFGISETVNSDKTSFPVFFMGKNGKWAGLNDKKDVIIYHKLLNVAVGESNKGYGDGHGDVANRYQMNLVVYFDSKRTKLMPDEMFCFIQAVLPEFFKVEGSKFHYIRVSVSSAILNSQQVFGSEYRGIAYSLKPEQSLLSIGYQIESRFKKGCFNCCSEV